ncbi:MAG: FGGY family carbohydrate kinase, partial [Actinomycetota bacterium]|nr:FGGY family carbohydrate kinase [Actinomycetota bacterium]
MAVTWVGVDVGTQSIRALAVDDDGRTVAAAKRPLRGTRSGTRHEQDPDAWWVLAAEALSELDLRGREVGGVAVCATSGTVLLTDADGTPRTPGLMYDDARAGALSRQAQEAGEELWTRLGYRMQPAWALPKLLWWRDKGLLGPGVRLAHQPDVVAAALVGHPVASDASHALKTGYDLIEDRWPTEVLAALDVPESALPE